MRTTSQKYNYKSKEVGVMFYDKNYLIDKPDRKRYKLSSFKGYNKSYVANSLPCDYCDDVYNFGFKDGKLVSGLGISEFEYVAQDGEKCTIPAIPEGFENATMFCGKLSDENGPYQCVILSAQDKFTILRLQKQSQWSDPVATDRQFTSAVSYLYQDNDIMLFASEGKEGLYILSHEKGELVANALAITDLCTHYERVYAVVNGKRSSVWFSDTFDPYNWNVSLEEGGYIQLDGSLGNVLRVVSFVDYIYIFCEYGIYRLTAFADQLQFSIKRVHCDCGRILKNSICICGTVVIFTTFDGVYSFDGYDVAKFTDRLDDIVKEASDIKALYCRNKYYMSLSAVHEDAIYSFSMQNADADNLLVTIDTEDGQVEFYRGYLINQMCVMSGSNQNCVLVKSLLSDIILLFDESGSMPDNMPFRYWKISDIDFGEHINKKYLVGVDYCTDSPFTLGVVSDGVCKEYILDSRQKYKPLGISGVCFDFYIKSDIPDAVIKPFYITVDFLRRA